MTAAIDGPTSNPLISAPILPTLARLAVPNLVAMLATAFVAIAETNYAGRLGTPALAGLAIVFPMVMLQQMMSAGAMGGGISSSISRAIGMGDIPRAQKLAAHAVIIGAAAGLLFTVFFWALGPAIYRLLGGSGGALAEAVTYSNIVFLGASGIWLSNTLASILRGTGNMRTPSLWLLLAAVSQVVLSGVLGLGAGPIPRFGLAGIAAGQVVAMTGAALALFAHLRSRRARIRLDFAGFKPDAAMFYDILKVGAVAVLSPFMSVMTVLILTSLVARAGIEAIAGYGIGARLEFLLVPIIFAVGVASVPMVGMAIGAGDIARARRVAWTTAGLAAVMTGLIGLVVFVAPDLWSGLFTSEPLVLAGARNYFNWAGPGYAFYGIGLALYFATQGSGKIVGPVLAQALRFLVIAGGAWLLVNPTQDAIFRLVAAAMLVYGAASMGALAMSKWGHSR